jgi:hypothetical protein
LLENATSNPFQKVPKTSFFVSSQIKMGYEVHTSDSQQRNLFFYGSKQFFNRKMRKRERERNEKLMMVQNITLF